MYMLIADGVRLPSPDVYEVPTGDLDSEGSGRNEEGIMQRDRIREGARTIKVGWFSLTEEETAIVLSATKKEKFDLQYLDPELGIVTKSVYAGPKENKLIYLSETEKRWSVRFNFIEN